MNNIVLRYLDGEHLTNQCTDCERTISDNDTYEPVMVLTRTTEICESSHDELTFETTAIETMHAGLCMDCLTLRYEAQENPAIEYAAVMSAYD